MPACILETFNCSSIIIINITNTIIINNIIIKSTIIILRCQFVYLKLLIAPPQRNDTEISSAGGCWRRQQWQTQTQSCLPTKHIVQETQHFLPIKNRTCHKKVSNNNSNRNNPPSNLPLPAFVWYADIPPIWVCGLAKSLWVWKAIKKLPHIPWCRCQRHKITFCVLGWRAFWWRRHDLMGG